ncbi:hypothetical protein C8J56DRAFT_921616, partial [Mycena floridula]
PALLCLLWSLNGTSSEPIQRELEFLQSWRDSSTITATISFLAICLQPGYHACSISTSQSGKKVVTEYNSFPCRKCGISCIQQRHGCHHLLPFTDTRAQKR